MSQRPLSLSLSLSQPIHRRRARLLEYTHTDTCCTIGRPASSSCIPPLPPPPILSNMCDCMYVLMYVVVTF